MPMICLRYEIFFFDDAYAESDEIFLFDDAYSIFDFCAEGKGIVWNLLAFGTSNHTEGIWCAEGKKIS